MEKCAGGGYSLLGKVFEFLVCIYTGFWLGQTFNEKAVCDNKWTTAPHAQM